jgi:hypothetical protein
MIVAVADPAGSHVPAIVPIGIVVAIVVANIYLLPGWWSGTRSAFVGQHRERALLPGILILSAFLAVFAVGSLADRGTIGETATRIIMILLFGFIAVMVICAVSIYWLNQPKFLVPPRLRREPGRLRQNRRRQRR